MTTNAHEILKHLRDSHVLNSINFGAVTVASEIIDAHLKDPAIREAWIVLRDVVIGPWIDNYISILADTDQKTEATLSAAKDIPPLSNLEKLKEYLEDRSVKSYCSMHKTISLSESPDVIKIGRLKSSNVMFDHESVARMHAVIERTGSGWKAIDLGSSSGTMRNHALIDKWISVYPGDILSFGECTLSLTD